MALSERTRPYEVLVRFYTADTFAAHQMYIREILEDGEVIGARELPPSPLDAGDIGAVVGEALPAIQASVIALTAAKEAAEAAIVECEAALADALAQRDAAQAQAADYLSQLNAAQEQGPD